MQYLIRQVTFLACCHVCLDGMVHFSKRGLSETYWERSRATALIR